MRDNIGYKIKEIRRSLHLRQNEFAAKIGIRQGYLSEIEAGKKIPGSSVILSLKRSFPEIKLDYLIGDEESCPIKQPNSRDLIRIEPELKVEELKSDYASRNAFRMPVIGRRMVTEHIKEGDILIIDPAGKPELGDFVLEKTDEGPVVTRWKPGTTPVGIIIQLIRDRKTLAQ